MQRRQGNCVGAAHVRDAHLVAHDAGVNDQASTGAWDLSPRKATPSPASFWISGRIDTYIRHTLKGGG